MRLWHKDLIPVLPRQQLLGQWRECCLIAKNLEEKGTPNHILVNPIMDYPIKQFISYGRMIFDEMCRRNYTVHSEAFFKHFVIPYRRTIPAEELFPEWHNERYFKQCLANLEEKHDRGGITDEEWQTILNYVKRRYIRHESNYLRPMWGGNQKRQHQFLG